MNNGLISMVSVILLLWLISGVASQNRNESERETLTLPTLNEGASEIAKESGTQVLNSTITNPPDVRKSGRKKGKKRKKKKKKKKGKNKSKDQDQVGEEVRLDDSHRRTERPEVGSESEASGAGQNTTKRFQRIMLKRKRLGLLMMADCDEVGILDDEEASYPEINDTRLEILSDYSVKSYTEIRLICFSKRRHHWNGSADFWRKKRRKKIEEIDALSIFDTLNNTFSEQMEYLKSFKHISQWTLPPFKPKMVGAYTCSTKPGLEHSGIYLYSEEDNHKYSQPKKLQITGREGVPLILPCKPYNPKIQVFLVKEGGGVPSDISYNPQHGFRFSYPSIYGHSGSYQCIFQSPSNKNESLWLDVLVSSPSYDPPPAIHTVFIKDPENGQDKCRLHFLLNVLFISLCTFFSSI